MRAAKVDKNQPVVVAALRALGFKVQPTHTLGGGAPDFVVLGYHEKVDNPFLLWVELKCADGKLTPDECKWHREWYPIHRWSPIATIHYGLRDILDRFGWTNNAIERALLTIKDQTPVKRALADARRKYGEIDDILESLL